MRYISFCSGIEATTQAWSKLGWSPVAFSEIEPFPCAVLESHYPNIPNLGDCRNIHYDYSSKELYVSNPDGTISKRIKTGEIDLCVGGFPCQSFSTIGKGEGLNGKSGLILEYFRLISEIQPRWVVYENVPGMLTSNKGNDFKFLISKFVQCGYSVCWRTLDTQYVRVEPFPYAIPQRRRRVFLVGYRADSSNGGYEVLLEQEGLRNNQPPCRIKTQESSSNLLECNDTIDEVIAYDGYNQTTSPEVSMPLRTANGTEGDDRTVKIAVSYNNHTKLILRCLTPIEYERLQGMEDNWTLPNFHHIDDNLIDRFCGIHHNWSLINGKKTSKTRKSIIEWLTKISSPSCPSSPRYKAIGNSMSVNAMFWVGKRIEMFDKIIFSH